MVSTDTAEELHISEPRINDRIRVPEVRLVGPNGEQVGIVRVEDALRLAQEADLDLVEVAPQAKPPVCKLMDYGKFKYEAAIKDREARKNQSNTVLKTVRLRLKIDPHDYATKMGMATKFLGAGDKVKVMIMFRGREQSRPEMGYRLLQRFAADVVELGAIESSPQQDGRNMVMVIGPLKRKADAKAEQKRRRDADAESAAAGDPDALLTPAPAKNPAPAETPAKAPAGATVEAAAPEATTSEAAPEPAEAATPRAATPKAATPKAPAPAAAPADATDTSAAQAPTS